jgi:hypothetical protein
MSYFPMRNLRNPLLQRLISTLAATIYGLTLASQPLSAEESPAADKVKQTSSKFLRLERDGKQPVSLQTAVVRYVSPVAGGTTVDLIGAVHIAEKSYYDELNKLFEQYDVVLYELVAPPGTRIERGTKPGAHPIAMLQGGMKDMLELEHQLEHVDYTKQNLVHADMSPEEFSKSMSDRGESMWSMIFRMMGEGMARQANAQANGKSMDAQMLLALFDERRALALKRVLAEQFEEMGGTSAALDGPQGSTIITERNKVAFNELGKQIKDGKRRIAVFYGAGHLPDMEKRLLNDFQLKRDHEQWLTAWHLKSDVNSDRPKQSVKN